jgi:glycerol-3-phosphate dehydrogenase (NAD(P)+)
LAEETLEAAYVVQVLGEALPKLVDRGVVSASDFPLMQALIDIVVHEQPVDLPLDAFF